MSCSRNSSFAFQAHELTAGVTSAVSASLFELARPLPCAPLALRASALHDTSKKLKVVLREGAHRLVVSMPDNELVLEALAFERQLPYAYGEESTHTLGDPTQTVPRHGTASLIASSKLACT